jgi:outer membrane translocation and assembly module TamA
VADGTGVSTGGDYMALVKAELRFAILSWMDGAIFIDGGNLWVDASQVNLTDLRYAVGGGISVPLPIGPAELGVGVPLHPDPLLQEPTYRIFLSIGAF